MKKHLMLLPLIYFTACHQEKGDFALCGWGMTKPYYVTGLSYKGEIFEIEKTIKENYSIVYTNNSGIAKIRFNVNCHGQVGNLHYESYDENYIKKDLNDTVKMQLMSGVSALTNWIPGKNEAGEAIDSHHFLSFRIKNGNITTILPK